MTTPFKRWLNSQDCYSMLRLCAGQVIKRADRLTLQLDDGYLDRDDYLESVVGQLWQFVQEKASKISDKGTALLVAGDSINFMIYLSQEFIAFSLDKRRADNPFHAYYRHLRTVLSKEDGIRCESLGRKGSYYACSDAPTLNNLPDSFASQNYSTWPLPDVAFRNIHEKAAMLKLARGFWDESLHVFLAAYLLPIRELTHFVASNYPLIFTESTESSFDVSDDEDGLATNLGDCLFTSADSRMEDVWKRQTPELDKDIVDNELEMLAQDCVAELSERQRLLLLMKMEDDMTYEEICLRLSENSPSKLHYHIKKSLDVIRQKWSLWGPPSLKQFADVDQEEFYLFYEKVISICKNGTTFRSNKEDQQP